MGNPGAARDPSGLTMDRPVRKVNGVDAHEAAEIFARQFPSMYLRFHRRDAKGTALAPTSRAVLQHLALAGPVTVGELSDTSTGPNRS